MQEHIRIELDVLNDVVQVIQLIASFPCVTFTFPGAEPVDVVDA